MVGDGTKTEDGTEITITTQENAIKNTFGKKQFLRILSFFKHPVYRYVLKKDSVVRLDCNSLEKGILCREDTAATYRLLDISLEYETVFDERYAATTMGKLNTVTALIPYTNKKSSIHYQTIPKKRSSQVLFITKLIVTVFLINVNILPTNIKNLTILPSKKF